jgi:hypothetical protein
MEWVFHEVRLVSVSLFLSIHGLTLNGITVNGRIRGDFMATKDIHSEYVFIIAISHRDRVERMFPTRVVVKIQTLTNGERVHVVLMKCHRCTTRQILASHEQCNNYLANTIDINLEVHNPA